MGACFSVHPLPPKLDNWVSQPVTKTSNDQKHGNVETPTINQNQTTEVSNQVTVVSNQVTESQLHINNNVVKLRPVFRLPPIKKLRTSITTQVERQLSSRIYEILPLTTNSEDQRTLPLTALSLLTQSSFQSKIL
jgi:hypothetical protein